MMVFLVGVYFFPTENSLKNFYYATVLAPFLLTLRTAELKRLSESKLFLAVAIFVFYIYLTINWNPLTHQSQYLSYFARSINIMVFMAALCRVVGREPEYLDKLFEWMVYIAGVMTLVSIAIFYADRSFPTFRLGSWGALYHANTGASCYGIAVVVCYCHFILDDSRNRRWLYFLILAVLMLNIALTLSRGVWLALISAYFITHMIRKRYSLILMPLCIAAIYILLVKFDVLESSWYLMRGGGDHFRFAAWTKVLDRIVDAPWFGFGVNTDESLQITESFTLYHAHSVYFSHLIYGGIVAVILLAVVSVLCIVEAIKLSIAHRDTTYAALVIYALVGVATDHNQLLLNPAQIWYFFWFPIAMIIALPMAGKRYPNGVESSSTANIASIDDANFRR